MQSHTRDQHTAKSRAVLALWTAIFLVLGVGCGGPTPTQTPTPVPVAMGETPSISLAPPGPTIEVQPGEPLAISAHVAGVEPQVTWTATCRVEKECKVLQNATGPDNFFTAPDTPGELITVRATVKDKYDRENSATLAFEVQEPAPTPTPSPMPTNTSTLSPTNTPKPTPGPEVTDTLTPITEPTLSITVTPTPTSGCSFSETPFRTPIGGPPVGVQVNITSIPDCADNLPTASSIPFRGTYSGDMANKEIWILVYPPNVVYYPQTVDACKSLPAQFADGQWSTIIRLGRAGVPEAFYIVAVVADVGSPASVAFHDYLDVGCKTGNYQGLTLIPAGATELDSIVVHTK